MKADGTVAPGYEGVREAFELAHHDDPGGSQLCVYRHGERIIDLWIGSDLSTTRAETGDTLHMLMSTTKGVLAIAAAMLVERGLLDVDAPVGEYWPEYAVAGKETTTTAHFLSHTAGFPAFRGRPTITSADLPDWDNCVRALAEAGPYWEPGTAFGYHAYTYGFLVGEVIRRITGMSAGHFLAENIAGPLGLDLWVGLPAERMCDVAFQACRTAADFDYPYRLEAFRGAGPEADEVIDSMYQLGLRFLDGYLTTPEGRACELGGVNGIGSARSVAKTYAATLGEVDGVRLLSSDTLEASIRPRTAGVPWWPKATGVSASTPAVDYGLGFTRVHPLGDRGRTPTFGHHGGGGIQGFASVELGVAVGYTCSAMHMQATPDPRLGYLEALVEAGLA